MAVNETTPYGQARAAMINKCGHPAIGRRWRENYNTAFAVVEPGHLTFTGDYIPWDMAVNMNEESATRYARGIITTAQEIICDFCSTPRALVRNGWEHLHPVWRSQLARRGRNHHGPQRRHRHHP